MKILEFLSKKAITADLKSVKKEDSIKELVDLLITAGEIEKKSRAKLIELLMARESLALLRLVKG